MAYPFLKRFDTTVLKDKSGSDTAQVPASATIAIYRQGATLTDAFSVGNGLNVTDVAVSGMGQIEVGDSLQVFKSGALQSGILTVVSVDSETTLTLHNGSGASISGSAGDRLVPTNARPEFYSDPLGASSAGNSISTTSSTGRAGAYIRAKRFDYLASGSGFTTRLYPDANGSHISSLTTQLNALQYDSIQAAIDALPTSGGTVFLPAGTYEVASTVVIPAGKRVSLIGEGRERSIIHCSDPAQDIIVIKGTDSVLMDLSVIGPYEAATEQSETTGRGVVIGVLAADNPTDILRRVSIIRCSVRGTASWCLWVRGRDDDGADPDYTLSIWGTFEDSIFQDNQRFGLVRIGKANTTQYFDNCAMDFARGYSLKCSWVDQLECTRCTFEGSDDTQPYVWMTQCNSASIGRCWFEHHGGFSAPHDSNSQRFILLSGENRAITLDSCMFVRHASDNEQDETSGSNPYIIQMGDLTPVGVGVARTVIISNCTFDVPHTLSGTDHLKVDNQSECVVVGFRGKDGAGSYVPQWVTIDDASGADSRKGSRRTTMLNWAYRMRIPRVLTSERATPPTGAPPYAAGDLVFDIETARAYLHDGSSWQALW